MNLFFASILWQAVQEIVEYFEVIVELQLDFIKLIEIFIRALPSFKL